MDGEQRAQLEAILENMKKEKSEKREPTPPRAQPEPVPAANDSWAPPSRESNSKERHNSG